MDASDYKLYRGYLSDSVRRSLSDCHVDNLLPADLAAAFEKSPQELVDRVVDVLLPNVLRAQGLPISASENERLTRAAQSALREKQTFITLTVLAVAHQNRQSTAESRLADGALLFCARGRKLLRDERYREATVVFRRAIEIKGDAKPAWLGLAEALEKLGEDEQAKEARSCAERL